MLNSGKKNCALRDKKNKYSNSRVVRKKILNEAKNHNPHVKIELSYYISVSLLLMKQILNKKDKKQQFVRRL
jgi:hypothetical protein